MSLAYHNNRFLPANELGVSVYDAGFVQGVTVAEQLRTFGGKLFRLDEHLQRLAKSLAIIGVESGHSPRQLAEIAEQIAKHNHGLLDPDDDLGVTILVTPGMAGGFAPPGAGGPTVIVHAQPVNFGSFAAKYAAGETLVVSSVQQVPGECWPSELKCRSRMHYFLADREARKKQPGARALLLDQEGNVCEASTANVLAYFQSEGLVSPKSEKILPGITLSVLQELARGLNIPWVERDIMPQELHAAGEMFLCSTSPCVLPVVALDGRALGTGQPGPVFHDLLAAFGRRVGLDIAAQAERFARR